MGASSCAGRYLDVDFDECAAAKRLAICVLTDSKVAISIALPQPLLVIVVLADNLPSRQAGQYMIFTTCF